MKDIIIVQNQELKIRVASVDDATLLSSWWNEGAIVKNKSVTASFVIFFRLDGLSFFFWWGTPVQKN